MFLIKILFLHNPDDNKKIKKTRSQKRYDFLFFPYTINAYKTQCDSL